MSRDSESVAPNALGIEAASFWSVAEKDIAESPTAEPERPYKEKCRVERVEFIVVEI